MIVSQFLAQNPDPNLPFTGSVEMMVQVTSIEPCEFRSGKYWVNTRILDDAGTGVSGQETRNSVRRDDLIKHFSADGKQRLKVYCVEDGKLRLSLPLW